MLDLLCNEFILGADIFTLIEVQEVLLAKDAIFKILREVLLVKLNGKKALLDTLENLLVILDVVAYQPFYSLNVTDIFKRRWMSMFTNSTSTVFPSFRRASPRASMYATAKLW